MSILMVCLVLIGGDHIWLWCHNALLGLFGSCAIIWPILLCYISLVTAFERQKNRLGSKVIFMIVIIALFCAAVYIFTDQNNTPITSYWDRLKDLYTLGIQRSGAGLFSGLIGIPFVAALGSTGAKIVIILSLFVAVMILTGTSLVQLFRAVTKPADMMAASFSSAQEQRAVERARQANSNIDIALDREDMAKRAVQAKDKQQKNKKLEQLEKVFGVKEPVVEKIEQSAAPVPPSADKTGSAAAAAAYAARQAVSPQPETPKTPEPAGVQMTMFTDEPPQDGTYHFPPVTMLETTKELSEQDVTEELKLNGQMLVQTLKSFGVQTKIVDISRGPAVTRYELQPAAGVKISKITNLSDDIAMNLAASGVRIEAPIPGKAAVGIEVPNKKVSVVRMRELIESNSFGAAKSRLTVVLGRDIAGAVATADLSKMPHLLIAGATGSGKSVCINSFIVSLLYKSTPEEVKFLMIDPKVVELGIYNGIPQLLVPVVTDPRKAAGALGWAVTEMLKRYKTFAANNVRDLGGYNALAESNGFQDENGQPMPHLPQIVIIIDELADLMMAAPNEVEDSICRLAQMARAAGMHLLIATQRPSVDVITGIIKANIPSRIAFSVSSQVDSRTILDMGGAEKLLGRGDMLFSPVGSQKPTRIQGCFVSDSEIESVVNFVKKSQEAGYDKNIAEEIEKNAVAEKDSGGDSGVNGDTDPMMPEAVKCVVEAGQASTSLLQRRLRLGYARAGRLVDEMEQMGIVGPHEGSKPRQVLITYQQWLEMTMQQADQKESEE
ncbi:MAG: DNA translocase FtsK [Ruminococcaceae bacterium]|nr:DNA translocase FtsK [Oscillospiraceae bacterium]